MLINFKGKNEYFKGAVSESISGQFFLFKNQNLDVCYRKIKYEKQHI